MTEGLKALLGCVQGQVSQGDWPGRPHVEQARLTEHVVLPIPTEGTHIVALTCRYCEQTVSIQVRSLKEIQRKRLTSRLAMAGSICLWSAATAFLLLYFLTIYPQPPGREVAFGGFLLALGVALWVVVDGYDAFASDVGLGCEIQRSPDEKIWSKHVSREGMRALPCHVLLEAEPGAIRGGAEAGGGLPKELRKPTVRTTIAGSGSLSEARPGHSSRIA